jgi:AraC family transcriptional activator of pobA
MVHCELIADRSRLHDWEIKLHQHHGLTQLLYLRNGDARVCLDGQYHDMAPGHVVLVPQMCVHGFRFAPNAQGHVVTLAHPLAEKLGRYLGDVDVGALGARLFTLDPDYDRGVDLAFDTLEHEYRHGSLHRDVLMETLLLTVFIWLSRRIDRNAAGPVQDDDRGREFFRQFSQLIEEHYAEQWSVEQYARTIGITPAYLNVLCRQWAGDSALALIHRRVVLAAKRSLVYTSMTISVVSYTLGFSDPAYFTRFFKRHAGVSPREFRRQAATLVE